MPKKRYLYLIVFLLVLLSATFLLVESKRPPKATLLPVLVEPIDGLSVEYQGSFIVSGFVSCQDGNAGEVETYIQYSVGDGSSDFQNVDGTHFTILSGPQPQTQFLSQGDSYPVSWEVTGIPGTYEVRIYSNSRSATATSTPSRTVTIQGPAEPPGIETIDHEYQDPTIGGGTTIGTYIDTYLIDGSYEILVEDKNTQGTKNPTDDTTELGWIYEFQNLGTRVNTQFYFYGYATFGIDDTDTAFIIQVQLNAVWVSVLEVKKSDYNILLVADIPDDTSSSLMLRIIDNDQTSGNKVRSSLYIDQAYIQLSEEFVAPSGVEILAGGGYIGHTGLLIYEYQEQVLSNTYNASVKEYALDIIVEDIDTDGYQEVLVSSMCASSSSEYGVIEIFEYQNGELVLMHTLANPSAMGDGIFSMAVGDLDNDYSPFLEIFANVDDPNGIATIWKWSSSGYYMSYNITQPGASDSVAAGDLDADGDTELVLGVGFLEPGEPLIYVYENQSGGWEMVASYAGYSNYWDLITHMEIADINNDGLNELIVTYGQEGFMQVLQYSQTTGILTKIWSSQFPVLGFATGDVTHDGVADIVAPSNDTIYIVEWTANGFEPTITLPGMGFPYGDCVAIGDVNQDGYNEFALAEFSYTSVLGIYNKDKLLSMTFLPYPLPKAIAIGDYDNDAVPIPPSDSLAQSNPRSRNLTATTSRSESTQSFLVLNIVSCEIGKVILKKYPLIDSIK